MGRGRPSAEKTSTEQSAVGYARRRTALECVAPPQREGGRETRTRPTPSSLAGEEGQSPTSSTAAMPPRSGARGTPPSSALTISPLCPHLPCRRSWSRTDSALGPRRTADRHPPPLRALERRRQRSSAPNLLKLTTTLAILAIVSPSSIKISTSPFCPPRKERRPTSPVELSDPSGESSRRTNDRRPLA